MAKKSSNNNDSSGKKIQFSIAVDEYSYDKAHNCDELGEMMFDNEEAARDRLSYDLEEEVGYERSIEYDLRQAGLTDKADQLRDILKRHSDSYEIDEEGWLCACYCLSSTLPYPIREKTHITRLDEIPPIWEKYGLKFNSSPNAFYAVCEEDFVYWLAHRNPLLASKVKALQARKASPYEIAYTMFPNLSYDLKSGDKNFPIRTPRDIGREINEWINYYITTAHKTPNQSFSDLNLESGGRIETYFKTHPIYADKVATLNSCLRNPQPWEKGQYAPYNSFVPLFKLSKALGHTPYYKMPDGSHILSLDELKGMSPDLIEKAFKTGYLDAWIATFFQDDPTKNIKDEVSYAKEAQKFTEFIDSIYPSYLPAKKFKKALREIDDTALKYKKATRTGFVSSLFKWILAPVVILMFLLVIGFCFKFPIPDYNVVANHYLGFSLTIGLVVLIAALCFGLTLFEGLVWGAIVGFGGTWILKLLMGVISPYLTWVYLAIVLAVFIFFMVKLWPVYQRVPGYAYVIDVAHPDYKLREMNALAYAYGPRSYSDPGDDQIASYLTSYKSNKRTAQKSQFGYVCGGIGAAFLLLIGLYLLSPAFGGQHSLLYDTVNTETESVSEPVDSVAPKTTKKATRKSKAKSKKTATTVENAAEDNKGTAPEQPVVNQEEVKNEEVKEAKEETQKTEEVTLDQLPQVLRDKMKKNKDKNQND